ncbi:MAG: pyridoxine 5'-phosphate synthase [candidate division Zixibacteria bacterium SM23_73_3]|nr:MAG: pyridoxine 5'-phosphate synthase [candidate division Zixibacteria bacterium SM23_73_3]
MAKLSINVDHVATLREARKAKEPDPVAAAIAAEMAGADGITVHLRGDRRHIQDRDLKILRGVVKTTLNLEMAATNEMMEIALQIKPDMVTLVPEKEGEVTTEGGLDVDGNFEKLNQVIAKLQLNGVLVSLFVNPDEESIKTSAKLRADYVEINTDSYACARNVAEQIAQLERLERMATLTHRLNLGINMGHGLDYRNIVNLVQIQHIHEFSIGHAIVGRAVLVGFEKAVREMLDLVKR